MKSNTINKLLLSLTIFIICFFSIGFSVLNKELTITGNINYRPKGDIRITNIENGDITGATIQYIDYSRREIKLGYKSTGSASVSIKVQVTNFENNEMGILSITNLPDDAKISDYTLGEKLTKSDGNPLKAGDSLTFTITFTSTVEELKEYNLIFDFEPICKISYENIEDTASLPKEVLKNTKNFTINFGSSAPDDLQVTMGDTPLEDYTYSNGSLIIPNVNGDIIISSIEAAPEYSDASDIHPNRPVLNGDMIPVVYNEDLKVWQKQDLDKSYDYSKQIWANAVTVTESSRPTYKSAKAGTVIKDEDINTMWVWIPRYSYTIKSEDGGNNYYGKASYGNKNPTRLLPGEIDVKFVGTSTTDSGSAQYTTDTGTSWRTNEAFNFDSTPRAGIWVGKFETTGNLSSLCINEQCNVSGITVLPNKIPIKSHIISNLFFVSRSMQISYSNVYGFSSNGDLHMAKNDEWGAVAYLSQSKYGKYGNTDYTGENIVPQQEAVEGVQMHLEGRSLAIIMI